MAVSWSKIRLGRAEYSRLLHGSRLLQEDKFGPKVYLLEDGRILKVFRIKRILSSNLWSPYARRFARHAEGLRARGIPSVSVTQWGRVPHLRRQYVLYPALPGETLRDLLDREPGAAAERAERFAAFLARLHRLGIYFRSCHLGNVLERPAGDLALIDVMDLRFLHPPLGFRWRLRNFRHVVRDRQDAARLAACGWERILASYEAALPHPDDPLRCGLLRALLEESGAGKAGSGPV